LAGVGEAVQKGAMEFSGDSPGGLLDAAIRILVAALAGLVIGIDREWKRKTAGLRAYPVVAVGAAAYTIAILEMSFNTTGTEIVSTDPTRIFQGLVGALGFIGAGAVIGAGEDGRAKGLVTAALIWVAGAIGICAGMGLYVHALAIGALSVGIVTVLEWVEMKLGHRASLQGPGRGNKETDEC
jgi:putative Mg2+ transporter-C (MgtC) family protein